MQLGVQLRTEIISLVSSAAWCGILVYFETRFCHFSIFRFSVATDDGDAVFTMCDAYSNDQKTVVYRKSYMGTRIMHYVTVFIQLFHWITHIQYILLTASAFSFFPLLLILLLFLKKPI